MIHDGVGSYMLFCITPYLYGVTDARLVVMGKRELVSSAETSHVQGKRYDWWSAGAADEVASCLARGVVLGMRTDVY